MRRLKAKLADTGGEPLPGSAADLAKLMAAETEKWGKVVKAAGNIRRTEVKPQAPNTPVITGRAEARDPVISMRWKARAPRIEMAGTSPRLSPFDF